jgi:glycosyltransferase involved in cell wall biosynthesis
LGDEPAHINMSQPRIFLNDNLVYRNLRGMRRYFLMVSAGIIAHFGSRVTLYTPERQTFPPAHTIQSVEYKAHQPLRVNQVAVTALALALHPAVLFNAYYTNVATSAAQVFPLYDMTPERLPQYFNPAHLGTRKFMAEKKRCLERAALVLSISAASARDALDYYPTLDASKIVTTPLGVDEFFFGADKTQMQTNQKPFFLFVGHRMQQKNFSRLLVAYKQSGLAHDFDLRVISPGPFSPDESAELRSMDLQNCVHLSASATDEELREAYRQSTAFIYPSLYEGFGLPILEAMASGTLVVTSNVSSMPEVGGDVAAYCDPYDPQAIAQCLWQAAQLAPPQRAARIAQGIARARTFTWSRCQQQTVNALARLLETAHRTGQPAQANTGSHHEK